MNQMNVPESLKINIDFDDKNLSEAVRTLQPLIFQDGDMICCLLGPDHNMGVLGRGATVYESLLEWESNVRKRIIYPKKDDELANFITDKLNASKDEVG